METRWLDALSHQKAVDGLAVNAQDTPDADGIKPAVVNQPSDRLGMDAELVGDLSHAYETSWFSVDGRHNPYEDSQFSWPRAWAIRTKSTLYGT